MTTKDLDLLAYYRARALEYEKVYAKPERQTDLGLLQKVIPSFFAGHRVLEVACGTGYWPRLIEKTAVSIVAIDAAEETLAVARAQQLEDSKTEFCVGDAFELAAVSGDVNAGFAGFWWSHVLRDDLPRLLKAFHSRLPPARAVLIVDNRYVQDSNRPIGRTDVRGNTYQRRRLDNGDEYEVLKNFPTALAVRDAVVAAGGNDPNRCRAAILLVCHLLNAALRLTNAASDRA